MYCPDSTLLAIDASTEVCSVAISRNGVVLSSEDNTPNSHAKVLLPLIDKLLADAGTTLNALDAVSVSLGPGSFTGIRICLGVAQGLAYGAKLPIVGASSLEVLAAEVAFYHPHNDIVIPCLDARMGEVYWSAYRLENNALAEIAPPQVSSPDQFNRFKQSLDPGLSIVGGGHGWNVDDVNKTDACFPDLLPHAKSLLSLWSKARLDSAMKKGEDIFSVEPLYVRNEVAWEKRTRIRDKNDH